MFSYKPNLSQWDVKLILEKLPNLTLLLGFNRTLTPVIQPQPLARCNFIYLPTCLAHKQRNYTDSTLSQGAPVMLAHTVWICLMEQVMKRVVSDLGPQGAIGVMLFSCTDRSVQIGGWVFASRPVREILLGWSTEGMNGLDKTIKASPHGDTHPIDDPIHLWLHAAWDLSKNIWLTAGVWTAQVFQAPNAAIWTA